MTPRWLRRISEGKEPKISGDLEVSEDSEDQKELEDSENTKVTSEDPKDFDTECIVRNIWLENILSYT